MSNIPVLMEPGSKNKGKKCYSIWRQTFEIDDTYEPIKAIGRGAYGVVCSANDHKTGEKVAIKRIAKAFENVTDARRTLREIKLLRELHHENIINVKNVLSPPESEGMDFQDVYIVYELMDTDLHQIIRSSQTLTDDHYQYFLYQILCGLKYVHSANVLHRDLKPSNLLLDANCDLKICDFGLARTSTETGFLTEYVVTRWYRSPELLLCCENYTSAIDMWSVGCIFAEILLRKPLFPGRDYIDQLKVIIAKLGTPIHEDTKFIKSNRAISFIRGLPHSQPGNFRSLFNPDTNPEALDLIEKMLQFNPAKRITVGEALAHPYLSSLHDPNNEPGAPYPYKFDFDDSENEKVSENDMRTELKRLVFEEMKAYKKMQEQQA